MNLTELAGSKERWLGITELFDGGQFKALSPNDIVALNTEMGDHNLPIDKTGFLGKHKFKQEVGADRDNEDISASRFFILQVRHCVLWPLLTSTQTACVRVWLFCGETRLILCLSSSCVQGGLLRYFKNEADEYATGESLSAH